MLNKKRTYLEHKEGLTKKGDKRKSLQVEEESKNSLAETVRKRKTLKIGNSQKVDKVKTHLNSPK